MSLEYCTRCQRISECVVSGQRLDPHAIPQAYEVIYLCAACRGERKELP